ncbi:hypothetical protein BM451_05065 [Dickeya dadantii]|nr:hypothetical protein BM451_05065 [Dickeya dadantii]
MCIFTSVIVTIVAITGTATGGAIQIVGMSAATIMPARFITTHRHHPRHVLSWLNHNRFMLYPVPDRAALVRDGAGVTIAAVRVGNQRVDGKEAKRKPRQYGAVFYCQP